MMACRHKKRIPGGEIRTVPNTQSYPDEASDDLINKRLNGESRVFSTYANTIREKYDGGQLKETSELLSKLAIFLDGQDGILDWEKDDVDYVISVLINLLIANPSCYSIPEDDGDGEKWLNSAKLQGEIVDQAYECLYQIQKALLPDEKYFKSLMGSDSGKPILLVFKRRASRDTCKYSLYGLNEILQLIIISMKNLIPCTKLDSKLSKFEMKPNPASQKLITSMKLSLWNFLREGLKKPYEGVDPNSLFEAISVVLDVLDQSMATMDSLISLADSITEHKGVVEPFHCLRIGEQLLLRELSLRGRHSDVLSTLESIMVDLAIESIYEYTRDTYSVELDVLLQALKMLSAFGMRPVQSISSLKLHYTSLLLVDTLFELILGTEFKETRFPVRLAEIYGEKPPPFVTIVLHSLLYLKSVTTAISAFLKHNELDKHESCVEDMLEVWYKLLTSSTRYEELNNYCEIICYFLDCYGCINDSIFKVIDLQLNDLSPINVKGHVQQDHRKLHCIVYAIGYARYNSELVRTRAARTLALYLECETLTQGNEQFLLDCLAIIKEGSYGGTFSCQMSCVWALGNLADALGKHYCGQTAGKFDWDFYQTIFDIAKLLYLRNPKFRYNACRVFGGLVTWTPTKFLGTPELYNCIGEMVTILTQQIGSGNDFKVRWNASYSLGCFVQNDKLWSMYYPKIAESIFAAFLRVLKASTNVKERSFCVKAILSIKTRKEFGEFFRDLWNTVLFCYDLKLDRNPSSPRVLEKYMEEVKVAIAHLASLTTPEDFESKGVLEGVVAGGMGVLTRYISEYGEHSFPWHVIEAIKYSQH